MQALSTVTGALGSVKKAAGRVTHRQSQLENNLAEATSNAKWGCANTLLHEIARSSLDFQEYTTIMTEIWSGMSEKGPKWRRVLKSVSLLEFLMKNGN